MSEAPIFKEPLLYRRIRKKELEELIKSNYKHNIENFYFYKNIKNLKDKDLPKINLYTNYGDVIISFPKNYPFSSPIINFSTSWKINNKKSYIIANLYIKTILPTDIATIIYKYLEDEIITDFKKGMYLIFNNSITKWIPNYSYTIINNWNPAYSLNTIVQKILSINKYLPDNKHFKIISNS